MPLQGAIAGCHCSVLSLWGEGKDQLWGVDMVPLLGAIVLCYGGGEGDGQLWRSGRGAIAGCHCGVLRFRGGGEGG